MVYDIERDPAQSAPVTDPALEAELARKLLALLQLNHAPPELYARYGLPGPDLEAALGSNRTGTFA